MQIVSRCFTKTQNPKQMSLNKIVLLTLSQRNHGKKKTPSRKRNREKTEPNSSKKNSPLKRRSLEQDLDYILIKTR